MFAYYNYLEIHLKRCPVLASNELWKCENCSRKYSTEEYLNMHMKNDCEKKESLKNNERKCTEKDYCCRYCGEKFATSSGGDLEKHLRTHSGERPYQCEHCGKAFKTNSDLKKHLRTHSGERPYQCEHCGKGFTQNSSLKKHLRTHKV